MKKAEKTPPDVGIIVGCYTKYLHENNHVHLQNRKPS